METRIMEQKQNLNEALYNIISSYSASTSAGMITDLIKDEMEVLLEHIRDGQFKSGIWTDEMNEYASSYINNL